MDAALATGIFFAALAVLAPWFGVDTRRSGGWDSAQAWEEVLPRPRRTPPAPPLRGARRLARSARGRRREGSQA